MTSTHEIRPIPDEVKAVETPAARELGISVFVQPDVALHQAKGATARRQFVRRALSTASLATSDAVAAGLSAIAVRGLADAAPKVMSAVTSPFASATEYIAAVLLALALTGNYKRSLRPHPSSRLLLASVLGTLVTCWGRLWAEPNVPSVGVIVLLALVTGCGLFLARGAVLVISDWALPDARRLVPAIVVTADPALVASLSRESGYRSKGILALDGRQAELRVQELARLIRRARAESVIVLGQLRAGVFARVIEIGLRAGCEVLCSPPGFELAGVRARMARRGPYDLIQVATPTLELTQFIAKRCVDVAGAMAAFLITLPLWLLIGLAIRLDSPGPVFFRQERVGIGGRRFRMLKFRTMRCGADEEKPTMAHLNASGDRRLFKIPNDPRVSRVGRFLRRWSLDELPQFLNVIAGQMSLVGPRPFFERDFAEYEERHFRRLGAKPGITGLWQVYGRSSVLDFEEVVRMDTEYIDQWSLWLDFRILAMTLPAVVRRTGAY
jgi:exopolysaccharide biosynthesis polyprenyl glycosylphosphotransferase